MAKQFNSQTESKNETKNTASDHDRIAEVAYTLWLKRGCPTDSAEDDWLRAEQELKNRATRQALTAA
jgi:hypothetical protein